MACALVMLLAACSVKITDDAGNTAVYGLINFVTVDELGPGQNVRAETVGLSVTSTPIETGAKLGYSQTDVTGIADGVLVDRRKAEQATPE